MEEKIREIVSLYIKVPANQITANTVIDRSAVASSILLHRMYAALLNEGVAIENYWDVKTFGILLQRFSGTEIRSAVAHNEIDYVLPVSQSSTSTGEIGIDIEEVSSMPQVNDFREDQFYLMNFTQEEIAYCILQPDSLSSFAGIFAVKEAIVKADNTYQNKPFNEISIGRLPGGKPFYPDFQLSISHTKQLAIAVAIPKITVDQSVKSEIISTPSANSISVPLIVSILTLLIVIVFMFIVLKKMS
jgi:phosphopantetheine--protein transferase-like protein